MEVPSFFLCPISLELMRDPVTLSTGMTYERASIEKWLGIGHNTCPTTNQVLDEDAMELIPNHTLRRLIQNWCVENNQITPATPKSNHSNSTSTSPTSSVHHLLQAIGSHQCPLSLRKLKPLAARHRSSILEAGGARIVAKSLPNPDALAMLATLLPLQEADYRLLAGEIEVIVSGVIELHAVEVLQALADWDPRLKTGVAMVSTIPTLVSLLGRGDERVVHASLSALLSIAMPRRNRVAAIDARAIPALIELLPGTEKRNKELAFAFLEILANCAEGREAITNNASAVPMIVRSMLGVSHRATEHAVAALWVVLSYASNRSVINTALDAGAFTNLLMLLPSECSQRAKLKARECLKLLNEVWGSYTCRVAEPALSIKRHGRTELV